MYAHESNAIKGPSVSISLTPTTGSGLGAQRGLFWPEQREPSPGLLMLAEGSARPGRARQVGVTAISDTPGFGAHGDGPGSAGLWQHRQDGPTRLSENRSHSFKPSA